MSEHGHNSGAVDGGHLKAFIERIERLHVERQNTVDDIAEVYAEVKSAGYDKKVVAHLVKLRAQDAEKRSEFDTILELYMQAVGMSL